MEKHKIRTTMRPLEELEVDDRELADLKSLGVVLEGTRATTEGGLIDAAQRQVAGEVAEATPTPTPKAPRKRASRARRPAAAIAADTSTPVADDPAGDVTTTAGDTAGDQKED